MLVSNVFKKRGGSVEVKVFRGRPGQKISGQDRDKRYPGRDRDFFQHSKYLPVERVINIKRLCCFVSFVSWVMLTEQKQQ